MGNYIGKIPFFFIFGAVNPTPEQIKVKFGREERAHGSFLPNVTLIGATCRPCVAKNPKIGS